MLPDVALADAPPPPPRAINAPNGYTGPFRQRAPASTATPTSAVNFQHVPWFAQVLVLPAGQEQTQFSFSKAMLGREEILIFRSD